MAEETVICTYRVKASAEVPFLEMLRSHWTTLHRLGFTTDEDSVVFRSQDDPPTYVEIFTWVDGGFERGHNHPDVLEVWERMDPLLERRDDRPKWEFPHFRRVSLDT